MNKPHGFLLLLLIGASTFLLTGCDDKKMDPEAPIDSNVQHIVEDPNYRPGENVPEPTLAEGQILNVRLVYEIKADDEDDAEWYKVELRRMEGGRWLDMVQMTGLVRSKENHWDDYGFYAKNFNQQLTDARYGIETLDGVYELIITGSNGYQQDYRLNWKEGRWTNINDATTFYVP